MGTEQPAPEKDVTVHADVCVSVSAVAYFQRAVTLEICLFGVVVTGLVYAFCVAVLGYHPRNERRVLGRLGWYLQYGATLVWEIVKANVQTMKVILSPSCLPPCRGAAAGAAGGGQLPVCCCPTPSP